MKRNIKTIALAALTSVPLYSVAVANAAEDIPIMPLIMLEEDLEDESVNPPPAPAPATTNKMPSVPSSVVNGARKTKVNRQAPEQQFNSNANERIVLTVKPGVNEMVTVAQGYPNRIVTPFSTPDVVSTSLQGMGENGECGEICIRDNVVYVGTNKAKPVTMYITEEGTQANAISLTMLPKRIPPKEITLKLHESVYELYGQEGYQFGNRKAETWEKSQPYVETIRTAFRQLALGEVPAGYTLGRVPRAHEVPNCSMPGIEVDFVNGQMLTGHNLSIFIGVATNVSGQAIEFKPSTCGNWDVAAATAYPKSVLEPREQTEVYVAQKTKKRRNINTGTVRPSLLGGR